MAKFMKRIVLILGLLALCAGMLGMTVCAANTPVSATIEVNTALSGDLPDIPDTFTVEMKADKGGSPMPDGTVKGVYTMTLQGAASAKVQLSFDRVGIYHYTLKQLASANGDCYADSGVYHITVYVTNGEKGDDLYLSVVLDREGVAEKQEEILFTNRYSMATQVSLGATVTLDKKPPKDEAFSFVLENEKGEVLQTVKNTAGMVAFSPMTFDSVGTYTYTMSEVDGKNEKIIYDRNRYTVIVTVVKDEAGNYQATVTYQLSDKELDGQPAFVNKTKSPNPQTGDSNDLGFWVSMMLLSGTGLAALWYYEKRGKQQNPEQLI